MYIFHNDEPLRKSVSFVVIFYNSSMPLHKNANLAWISLGEKNKNKTSIKNKQEQT